MQSHRLLQIKTAVKYKKRKELNINHHLTNYKKIYIIILSIKQQFFQIISVHNSIPNIYILPDHQQFSLNHMINE